LIVSAYSSEDVTDFFR
jgi:hypothetical protein